MSILHLITPECPTEPEFIRGTFAIYRYLTRITVRDIKPEWIRHHVSRYNIRKNDTELTGTMHYDIFPRITRLQSVLLYSIY